MARRDWKHAAPRLASSRREPPPEPEVPSVDAKRADMLKRWPEVLEKMGVPPLLQRVPVDLEVPEDLREWRGDPTLVALLGPVGTGKTWAATWAWAQAAIQLAAEWEPSPSRSSWDSAGRFGMPTSRPSPWAFGLWVSATDAAVRFRREVKEPPESGIRLVDMMTIAQVLLIDDLGTERDPSGFLDETWRYIILHRHNYELGTIITANANAVEQFEDLDARIADRLAVGLSLRLTKKRRKR